MLRSDLSDFGDVYSAAKRTITLTKIDGIGLLTSLLPLWNLLPRL